MGVRRAVEMALDSPTKYPGPIQTFGPLIHNPQVLKLFADKGVTVMEHVPEHGKGTVIIRAHGVPPATKQQLKDAGYIVIDATCPRVVKVQSIIKSHHRKGFATIIIGDQDHPEVISLLGFAGDSGYVAGSITELERLPNFEQAIVVAQTTQNKHQYNKITQWVAIHHPEYKVFETICDSTEKRQAEVRQLAESVDAIIVVGGKQSGNTRRLAEIAASTGKPSFHVETEEELDTELLAKMQTIGITAGASTPTWIIKNVYRAVEQIPIQRWRGGLNWLMQLGRYLLLTNLFVALGAGCLSYAMVQLLGLSTKWPTIAMAVLYILSMHTLNHLTGQDADKYNEPDRERFYNRFRFALTAMALIAGALGLLAAFTLGPIPFWTMLAMSLLGLSYNFWFLPAKLFPNAKYRRIRDVPGSKTILIALAWGVVTTTVPILSTTPPPFFASLITIVWATGLVFCRTAFFDVLDMQGDRIVGKETLPILLGTQTTYAIIKKILIVLIIVVIASGFFNILPSLAFLLAICPFLLWFFVKMYEHDQTLPGARTEMLVEGLFVLSGLLTFVYRF